MNQQLQLACTLVALFAAPLCCAEPLSILRPSTHETVIQQHVSINVQDGISLADARVLYLALPREAHVGSRPSIYRTPEFPQLFVVTADGPKSGDADYGLCLYVFQRSALSFKLLFRSKGMNDSYILRPIFFVGSGRTLVMAETGDETGTWQLHGFEITRGGVRYLGPLDAAGSDPQNPDCWINPLREARSDFVNGTYVVQVRGEIYLHPGIEERRKLPGGGWHKFVSDGKQFLYKP